MGGCKLIRKSCSNVISKMPCSESINRLVRGQLLMRCPDENCLLEQGKPYGHPELLRIGKEEKHRGSPCRRMEHNYAH